MKIHKFEWYAIAAVAAGLFGVVYLLTEVRV